MRRSSNRPKTAALRPKHAARLVHGRRISREDHLFEAAVERALGDRIRTDDEIARDMWRALANIEWRQKGGAAAA
jgi:SLT domain-containing protein